MGLDHRKRLLQLSFSTLQTNGSEAVDLQKSYPENALCEHVNKETIEIP